MKKIIEYTINICPLFSFPITFKVTKKEFEKFIKDYRIKDSEKIITRDTITEYIYKYESDGEKILLVKTILN